jgi:oxygen-independent coproporphyrinogen-3 oxidase
MKASGSLVAPIADWETKRRWVKEAFAELENNGYTVSSGYTAVRNPERTKFIYRDSLWGGADLLGVGVASFSHAKGVHYQNVTEIDEYQAAIGAGRLPTKRALKTTQEERMIREFILQMKLGRVEAAYFSSKFGVNILERFAVPLAQIRSEGLLNLGDSAIVLTRDGLLCVDNLLHDFFLPQHHTDKLV